MLQIELLYQCINAVLQKYFFNKYNSEKAHIH